MIFELQNEEIQVIIKKQETNYNVKIKSKENQFQIEKELSCRLELISLLEKDFSEQAFYKIP